MGRRTSLENLYKAYYRLRPPVTLPPDVPRREFAFQLWGSQSYVRHLSFEGPDDVIDFLAEKAPRQAYYSTAVYELPEAPRMEEKGWIGSELMFDIDADHLPGCEGLKVPSDECLRAAAREAEKLEKMLARDFGVKARIYFTGNRGFHVIASCEWCLPLGGRERRLIAEYVSARGLRLESLFPRARGRLQPASPSPSDPGWRGWLAVAISSSGGEPLSSYGGLHALEQVASEAAVHVDLQVTQDVTRLERIPLTLNGKASMLCVPVKSPSSFRPGRELSPFRGEVEVKMKDDVDGSLMGVRLGLRRGETASLPAHAAITLATVGTAELVGGEVIVKRDAGWGPV